MAWYKPWTWGDESQSSRDKRDDLNNQGGMASVFADQGQQQFDALRGEAGAHRQQLGRLASGEDSLSKEQLRQGLEQLYGQQRQFAASASPSNAPMAARTAAIQMGRLGAGASGQAALAGIQERRAAMEQLGNMINAGRQQELSAALGSRQNAISGYGGVTPEGSALEKAQPAINAGIGLLGVGLK